jgi:hypothetical protein
LSRWGLRPSFPGLSPNVQRDEKSRASPFSRKEREEWASASIMAYVASTLGSKCPSCGAEPGQPCVTEAGVGFYCETRIRSANPREYDSPCEKCNALQKAADDAGHQARAHVFGQVGRPKSRWPKALREMKRQNEDEAKRAGTDLQFHKAWEHHDAGTRVERINGRALAEMLTEPPTSDPSQLGTVIEVGYLNGKQTVRVKFDDGTFSAPSSYADQFRKLN